MEKSPSSPSENSDRDSGSSSSESKDNRPNFPRVPLSASEVHGGDSLKDKAPLFRLIDQNREQFNAESSKDDDDKDSETDSGVSKKKKEVVDIPASRGSGVQAHELHTSDATEAETPEPAKPAHVEPPKLEVPELKSVEDAMWTQFEAETAEPALSDDEAHAALSQAEFTQPITEINMPPQAEVQPRAPEHEHEIDLNMWHEAPIHLNEPGPIPEAQLTAETIPAAPSVAGITAEVSATEPSGDNWEEEFNTTPPAAIELSADERAMQAINEGPEQPAPLMPDLPHTPDPPSFIPAEQSFVPNEMPPVSEMSQERINDEFQGMMAAEMPLSYIEQTSMDTDDADDTQAQQSPQSYGRASTLGTPAPPTPGTGGPGNPNVPPTFTGGPGGGTPNMPPNGPNGPVGFNGMPNHYANPNNYGGIAGMAGPAAEIAARALTGAHAVEAAIVGGAAAGAVAGHMAGRGARRETRHLRQEVRQQTEQIRQLDQEQQQSNQQMEQMTYANQEAHRQQQSQQMQERLNQASGPVAQERVAGATQPGQRQEQERRAVTPQELAAVAAVTAAAEQQEQAERSKLAPGHRIVESAWHKVEVGPGDRIVEGQELGYGLKQDQKVETTPPVLTQAAAQQQASQFGALAASQQAYTQYPQQQPLSGGVNPMISSGQVDSRYDLPSGQADAQHLLPPPKNPVATALTSPLLWVGLVVLLLAFFAAAFL